MPLAFEDLRVLRSVEEVADAIWVHVHGWDAFTRDVVGKQLARAVDSIGANIAEAFGRYHYGEKLQFFYYARGSLYETKYWLNRVLSRELMPQPEIEEHASQLTDLVRQLNALAASTRKQRYADTGTTKTVHEPLPQYQSVDYFIDEQDDLFSEEDLEFLQTIANEESPFTNY